MAANSIKLRLRRNACHKRKGVCSLYAVQIASIVEKSTIDVPDRQRKRLLIPACRRQVQHTTYTAIELQAFGIIACIHKFGL